MRFLLLLWATIAEPTETINCPGRCWDKRNGECFPQEDKIVQDCSTVGRIMVQVDACLFTPDTANYAQTYEIFFDEASAGGNCAQQISAADDVLTFSMSYAEAQDCGWQWSQQGSNVTFSSFLRPSQNINKIQYFGSWYTVSAFPDDIALECVFKDQVSVSADMVSVRSASHNHSVMEYTGRTLSDGFSARLFKEEAMDSAVAEQLTDKFTVGEMVHAEFVYDLAVGGFSFGNTPFGFFTERCFVENRLNTDMRLYLVGGDGGSATYPDGRHSLPDTCHMDHTHLDLSFYDYYKTANNTYADGLATSWTPAAYKLNFAAFKMGGTGKLRLTCDFRICLKETCEELGMSHGCRGPPVEDTYIMISTLHVEWHSYYADHTDSRYIELANALKTEVTPIIANAATLHGVTNVRITDIKLRKQWNQQQATAHMNIGTIGTFTEAQIDLMLETPRQMSFLNSLRNVTNTPLGTLIATTVYEVVNAKQENETLIERNAYIGIEETQPVVIQGSWTAWGQWDDCSVSCGGGTTYRARECMNGDIGVSDCPGEPSQSTECGTILCPLWTEWQEWGVCSATCGANVFKTRTRDCTNGVVGLHCKGSSSNVAECTVPACENFALGQWGAWSSCNASCGDGVQLRTRKCNKFDELWTLVDANNVPNADCNTTDPFDQTFACNEGACKTCIPTNGTDNTNFGPHFWEQETDVTIYEPHDSHNTTFLSDDENTTFPIKWEYATDTDSDVCSAACLDTAACFRFLLDTADTCTLYMTDKIKTSNQNQNGLALNQAGTGISGWFSIACGNRYFTDRESTTNWKVPFAMFDNRLDAFKDHLYKLLTTFSSEYRRWEFNVNETLSTSIIRYIEYDAQEYNDTGKAVAIVTETIYTRRPTRTTLNQTALAPPVPSVRKRREIIISAITAWNIDDFIFVDGHIPGEKTVEVIENIRGADGSIIGVCDNGNCTCNDGFELQNEDECRDIDECEIDGICGNEAAGRCENLEGSFSCTCRMGHEKEEPDLANGTCTDVDECATGSHSCQALGQVCNNIAGSHECKCHADYYAKGTECDLIEWTQWHPWSTCSVECGIGNTTRTRSCLGGDRTKCVGDESDTMDCNTHICVELTIEKFEWIFADLPFRTTVMDLLKSSHGYIESIGMKLRTLFQNPLAYEQ